MTSNNVIILGIWDGHNAGACILRNGSIIAAISEERLSRIKNEAGYPKGSIEMVLEVSDVQPDEIDVIALGSKLTHKKEFYSSWDWYKVGYKEQQEAEPRDKKIQMLENRLSERKKEILTHLSVDEKKITVVEHHLAHASTAYYSCPWANDEKVLIFTCDGGGDGICATVSIGEFGQIRRISETESSASLGKIYSRTTLLLGMKPWEHEYKIMGLAPYADETGVSKSYKVMDKLIEVKDGSLAFSKKTDLSTDYCYQFLKTELENHRFDWIAGAVQKMTEDLLVKWVKNAIKKTGIRKIVCAGGVFMNVKANLHVLELNEVDNIFVFPSSGDESIAIGAAFNAYANYLNKNGEKIKINSLGPIYFGNSYSDEEIKNAITSNNLKEDCIIEYNNDIDNYVAECIANGEIVARFSGRMEWGARALGNRSILTDPSKYERIREINLAIKQRDFWMPFAPTVLDEQQEEAIINPKKIKSHYMALAFRTTENGCKKLVSAVHPYDFTARPQILEKEYNPTYHAMIKRFYELTGIPAVLNTSFNLHGEPIVCSPDDAIQTLKNSDLKHLAIGNYFIKKR